MANPSLESILSRLDDMGGRLATAKNLSDIQEAVGRLASAKQVIELQETLTKILTEQKAIRDRITELEESTTKSLKKLREEVIEAVDSVEVSDGDDPETLNFLKEQIGEAKMMAKAVLGDDVTLEAVRSKVRGWLGGKDGKKKLAGNDE